MHVPIWEEAFDESALERIRLGKKPVVLRGLVQEWPVVERANSGFDSLAEYLVRFDRGEKFQAMIAPASVRGRLFYREDMSGFNFDRLNGELKEALKILKSLLGRSPCPGFYIGSKLVPEYLPGFELENQLPVLNPEVPPTIWIGNAVIVATHNDDSENIACVAAGKRRFTLFPPDQEPNLYMGPADLTPAGRPISLVDLNAPDFVKFPRFQQAMRHMLVAELNPGDALYIPSFWWHHVESLSDMNVLVNYWWKDTR